jgi:cysteine desulfurase
VAGGSEANALALGAGAQAQGQHALGHAGPIAPQPWLHIGATEHASVRACAEALCAPGELQVLRCDDQGRTQVPRALPAGTRMVALTRACSETGVLQPTSAQVAACRAAGAWSHVDAVQAAGRVPMSFAGLGADSMAIAGHKLGAVGAIGVLVVHGARSLTPPAWAGAQRRRAAAAWACGAAERWEMPAEAHLPSILSLAAALQAAVATRAAHAQHSARARDALEATLRRACAPVRVLGGGAERLPNTSCLHLPGCSGEAVTMALDVQDLCISQGSACSSGASASRWRPPAMPPRSSGSPEPSCRWCASCGGGPRGAGPRAPRRGRPARPRRPPDGRSR